MLRQYAPQRFRYETVGTPLRGRAMPVGTLPVGTVFPTPRDHRHLGWRVLPNRYPRELGIVVAQPDGSWLAIRPNGTTHRHTSRSSAVHRLCLEAAKHGA